MTEQTAIAAAQAAFPSYTWDYGCELVGLPTTWIVCSSANADVACATDGCSSNLLRVAERSDYRVCM